MLKKHNQSISVLLVCLFFLGYFLTIFMLKENSMVILNYDLLFISSNLFSSSFLFDKISLSFSVVVLFISMNVFFFTGYYMKHDPFYKRFVWVLLLFVVSMNILIFSGSLFILLLGWDGLGVSSFALILYYQSKESFYAGFLTLLINRIGDVLIMSTMVSFVVMGSSLTLSYSLTEVSLIFWTLGVAGMTKSAQYPFCAWLPAAMAAPTPVSALVHSSTLVTAGIYIVIRSCSSNNLPEELGSAFLLFGSVTSFIGGFCAVFENDLKKLIALSTLSQLGVMVFCIGLGAWNLALLHLFTHAMFKALLFLVAGCILIMAFGVQDMRLLGAATFCSPLLLVFLNTSAFCLVGLPYLSSFFSKHLILSVMWQNPHNCFAIFLMFCSTALSSVYMTRLVKCLNWGRSASTISATPTLAFNFYLPFISLFSGSCFVGWHIIILDPQYMISGFMPFLYDFLIYLSMFIGVIFGLFQPEKKKSVLAASMFYMVPVWMSSSCFLLPLIKAGKALDCGWLEPRSYVGLFNQFVTLMNKTSLWPSLNVTFWSYIFLMIGLLCYLLKR